MWIWLEINEHSGFFFLLEHDPDCVVFRGGVIEISPGRVKHSLAHRELSIVWVRGVFPWYFVAIHTLTDGLWFFLDGPLIYLGVPSCFDLGGPSCYYLGGPSYFDLLFQVTFEISFLSWCLHRGGVSVRKIVYESLFLSHSLFRLTRIGSFRYLLGCMCLWMDDLFHGRVTTFLLYHLCVPWEARLYYVSEVSQASLPEYFPHVNTLDVWRVHGLVLEVLNISSEFISLLLH